MTTIVLGAQWGDEGKGKLVDILCVIIPLFYHHWTIH
jgi:adenylosuccinate synthase